MRYRILFALWLGSLPLLGALSTCGGDILDDPGFDLWCGEELCGWEVEAGEIRRVSTWHPRDYGVSLEGEEVVAQFADVDSDAVRCMAFELMADAAEDVDLELQIDFLDDGSLEYTQPMAAEDWQLLRFDVRPPDWFDGARFRIVKRGRGSAVLAQLRVESTDADDCPGTAIELGDRPLGADCQLDEDCGDARCVLVQGFAGQEDQRVCGLCADSVDCAEGEACGTDSSGPQTDSYLTCGDAGRHVLGEHCATDEECATSLCVEGQCGECVSDLDCATRGCRSGEIEGAPQPMMCGPLLAERLAGEACLHDEDCVSGSCAASEELSVCPFDGRRCDGLDDCPDDLFATCSLVGVYDGTCL